MDSNDSGVNGGAAADLMGAGGNGGGNPDPVADPHASGDPGADPNAGGDPNGGADPDWYATVSGDPAEGESASLRDWLKSAGVKDVNQLAKMARDNVKAARDSGRIKLPGEGASEAEIAEYRKAIGVPDDPTGYQRPEFKDAEGNPIELNTDMLDRVTALAHKEGLPAGPLENVLKGLIQQEMEEKAEAEGALTTKAQAHVKSWGEEASDKLAAIDQVAKTAGITRDEMIQARSMWGPERALDIFAKLGEGVREDVLVQGGSKKFGVNAAEAQKELETLRSDPKVMVPGSAENLRYNRLNDIVADAAAAAAAG